MNIKYLVKNIKDGKAVLLYKIEDVDVPLIIKAGTKVKVLSFHEDNSFPSGYKALIKLERTGTEVLVDKDYIMLDKDYKELYNSFIDDANLLLRGGAR